MGLWRYQVKGTLAWFDFESKLLSFDYVVDEFWTDLH